MPSNKLENHRVILASRPPEGPLDLAKTFKEDTQPVPEPKDGEVVVRVMWISLDPAMRGWLRDARSYVPPVPVGAVMRAGAIGKVIASRSSRCPVGTAVQGLFGWQEYAVVKADKLEIIEPPKGARELDFLGPLGMPGMTAYFGIKDVGRLDELKPGDTVVVTGAAGAVGAVVVQLCLMKQGVKVVAIAGSKEKLNNLKKMGCHEVINYKDADWRKQFKDKVGYLDIYFDNVGGEMLDYAMTRLKAHARIVLCGAISDYNNAKPYRLGNYQALISQKAKIEGFIVFDYEKRYSEGREYIAKAIADGKLESRFHIVDGGVGKCPEALQGLYTGANDGKMVVKVWDGKMPRENKL